MLVFCLIVLSQSQSPTSVLATTLPSQFSEALIAGGISNPTAMAFAPDGRIFVAQQNGALRVIENGLLLGTPFLTVSVDSTQERGLLGVAFDPDFETNQFVYIYYTTSTAPRHNRISRFTANGNVALPGEFTLMDLDNLSGATNHNGGALHFGPDGKLYVAVGDNANGNNSQTLNNRLGKMLRLNTDGSIPTDNPFYNTATGDNRSIWAWGLRNPFTFAFQPGTGRMFINEVGQNTWEEINDGIAGANYGWPTTEGETSNPQFRSPLYAYPHSGGPVTGCAITGGDFYNPNTVMFPASFVGSYFFADYCADWIRRYDPVADTVHNFASNTASAPVDIKVAPDGSLYYLAGANTPNGAVYRIIYTPPIAPVMSQHPANQIVAVGDSASFTCRADGSPTPAYQWQRNTVNIPTANKATYTLASAKLTDSGAQFRCVATNSQGSATSNSATLTVIDGERPNAAIDVELPDNRTLFQAGDTVNFSGTATDPEDGVLPASAYTWEVKKHHASHTHPGMDEVSGVTSESFDIDTSSHGAVNIWYRIYLTVVDSDGLTRTIQRDVWPQVVDTRLLSDPPGLQLKINGEPRMGTIQEIVGVNWFIEAPSPQVVNGMRWEFESWSDGGAVGHIVVIPTTNPTYTATFFGCPVIPDTSPGGAVPTRNYFTDNTPTLTWGQITWATGYEVQVDNEADFSDPEFHDDTLTSGDLSVTTTTLRDCTYYWRVRAKRANDTWGSWSAPDKFVINAVP